MPVDDGRPQVRRYVGADHDPETERLLAQPYQPLASANPQLFQAVIAELPTDTRLDWGEAVLISEDGTVEIVVDGTQFWTATTDGTAEHIVSTIRSALENLD